MRASKFCNKSKGFYEVEITIHTPDQYAEILEISRESENSPIVIQATSIKIIETSTGCESDINNFLRRRQQ